MHEPDIKHLSRFVKKLTVRTIPTALKTHRSAFQAARGYFKSNGFLELIKPGPNATMLRYTTTAMIATFQWFAVNSTVTAGSKFFSKSVANMLGMEFNTLTTLLRRDMTAEEYV